MNNARRHITIAIVCGLATTTAIRAQDSAKVAPQNEADFYLGQTSFPFGDSIEISSVQRTADQMTVRGRYNLVSAETAKLSLYITTHDPTPTPTDPKQTIAISRGEGNFELIHPNVVPGMPHVTMYSTNGKGFAGVYFGTKSEATEESKLDLGYYRQENGEGKSAAQLSEEGWQLWQKRKLTEATAKFQQAVQLASGDANAWNGLGWATFNSGKADEAEKAFLKAVELEPGHPAALNGLGQIYLSQRNYANAEKYLLAAAPKAPAAWYGLARLYLLQGNWAEAERWAQKVEDSGQGDAVAKKMLEAAKARELSEGLRFSIEPPAPAK